MATNWYVKKYDLSFVDQCLEKFKLNLMDWRRFEWKTSLNDVPITPQRMMNEVYDLTEFMEYTNQMKLDEKQNIIHSN